MASFAPQPPQEPALEQFGVEPIGLCPGDVPATRPHSKDGSRAPRRLAPQASAPTRSRRGRLRRPAHPRDIAAGPDRLIPPAMQHGKQPFWAGLQLLVRLTLNTRNDAANKPARLAQLDDGNDRA